MSSIFRVGGGDCLLLRISFASLRLLCRKVNQSFYPSVEQKNIQSKNNALNYENILVSKKGIILHTAWEKGDNIFLKKQITNRIDPKYLLKEPEN